MYDEMEEMRPQGRPRRKWMDGIRETMMELTQFQEVDWTISYDRDK